MSQDSEHEELDFAGVASNIVAAYVANNHVAPTDLPQLIASVHQAMLDVLAGSTAVVEEPVEKPNATQVRKSIQHDCLISFLDGRRYKTLKRHLSAHGLNPASYRQRFGLGPDYPMVAPAYSEKRSNLAKSLGLGRPGARSAATKQQRSAA